MAKRMKYSVVGLPHYTIWHLYEPSVDDIRHMEEMEQERKQREQEEIEKKERLEKIMSTSRITVQALPTRMSVPRRLRNMLRVDRGWYLASVSVHGAPLVSKSPHVRTSHICPAVC
jgi:hypothetical protein